MASAAETDLRSLLDADRQIVLDILDTAYKLVVDVGSHYYWTHYGLEKCAQLAHIGDNVNRLLVMSAPYWPEGKHAFAHPEPLKLWNTAVGLFRALQPERAKFIEQLTKRRRQRIMGQQNVEDTDLTDPVLAESDKERFKEEYAKLVSQYAALSSLIRELPAGLYPPEEGELPSLNGKHDGGVPASMLRQAPATQAPASPPPPELSSPD
jgi:hypothetical protein